MQLTTFTDYALRTMLLLASDPERKYSVKEVSEHYGISRNHLVKVVHRLAQLGYIISSKGKGGGIRINPSSTTLKLGDMVRALEPNMDLVECFNEEENTCKITSACDLKSILSKAKLNFIDYLNQYTLEDLNKHNLVQVLEIK